MAKLSTENKILNQSLSTQHTRVNQIIEKKDSIQQKLEIITLYKQKLESDLEFQSQTHRKITLAKIFDLIDAPNSLRSNFYKFCYLSDFHSKALTISSLRHHNTKNLTKIHTLESLLSTGQITAFSEKVRRVIQNSIRRNQNKFFLKKRISPTKIVPAALGRA